MAFTLADALTASNANNLPDALRKVDLGRFFAPIKSSVDQTAATTITLDPPAMCPAVVSCRVTAGAAAAGAYLCTDEAATPVDGSTCALSDDGATLTFAANVTEAVISYIAAPANPLSEPYAFTAP